MLKHVSQALALTCFRIVFRPRPGPHSKVRGNLSPWLRSYKICKVCSHLTGFTIYSKRFQINMITDIEFRQKVYSIPIPDVEAAPECD